MINYIYKRLQARKLKPYMRSKLNIWSIINPKHSFVNTNKLFFFFKNLNKISYATIGTLWDFFKIKNFIILISSTIVIISILIILI